MRIAVVFDNMIFGGIERVGISYIQLLKELGHDVDAYVLSPKTESIIDELRSLCTVYIKPLKRSHCPEAYWVMTRRIKGGKYLFPLAYIFVSTVLFFERLFKRKRTTTYDIAIAFSGHYNDLSFVAYSFIKAKKKVAWLHGALYQFVLSSQGFEFLYKKIKNIVVLVDDGQEEVIAYHQKDKFDFKIFKLYNPVRMSGKPVDLNTVAALKERYGDYLLSVARMNYPHKDHYTLIRALKILREKYGIERNLVLVGDGPERKKLEDFCKDLCIEDSVWFLGSQSDVQNYYAACSIFVHASVAGEGLPTVLLEAMDLGIPVVCTDSKVGPKEILGNNEYGLLAKVQDPNDMAEKINLLVNDPDLYCHYKEVGKERVLAFSPERVKQELKKAIDDLK